MSFDWRPESKDRYFRKAEAAVKAAGFDDILQISKEQFAITKSTVKVYFKPIPREGKTRRWWEAKKSITGMQEQSGEVPKPFIVMATQNPIGSSGTQMLPESQLDRFMICISMGYPDIRNEIAILKDHRSGSPVDRYF